MYDYYILYPTKKVISTLKYITRIFAFFFDAYHGKEKNQETKKDYKLQKSESHNPYNICN